MVSASVSTDLSVSIRPFLCFPLVLTDLTESVVLGRLEGSFPASLRLGWGVTIGAVQPRLRGCCQCFLLVFRLLARLPSYPSR